VGFGADFAGYRPLFDSASVTEVRPPCGMSTSTIGLMSDPAQTNLTDRMIARLEEANTRSYGELKRTNQSVLGLELGAAHNFTDRKIDLKQETSRPRRRFSLLAAVLMASMGIAALVWKSSYGDTTRQYIARFTGASGLQTAPQITSPHVVLEAKSIPPEFEEQLQRITDELAEARRVIDQLKISQEQISRNEAQAAEHLRATREQMVRENAKVTDQLNAALAETSLHEATVSAQLRATQQQLAEIASSKSTSPARKTFRRKRPSSQSMTARR
jgi:hypothetical protein